MRQFVLFLAVLKNFVLPMGRDGSHEILKVMSVVHKCSSPAIMEKLGMMLGVGHHTTLIVNILFKTSFFPTKGKKNNQSSVSDPDLEIPTLGSTDNAGNLVNLVSSIIGSIYPGVGISRSASKTDGRFYLSFPDSELYPFTAGSPVI